jgi:4-oxalmesaconate hydratase
VRFLVEVIGADNVVFASEMIGAVKGIDARSGHYFDDTKRYVDAIDGLSAVDREKIFEVNALKVYPRLKAKVLSG